MGWLGDGFFFRERKGKKEKTKCRGRMGVEKGMESFLIFHWGGEELQLGDLRITPGE